mmetsp:Transcript_87048/g.243621  ORF Transcript_87048/g.243621 Transcript_87048/m.243621 type:complete len:328 (-) Transcript_87048:2-985(-)
MVQAPVSRGDVDVPEVPVHWVVIGRNVERGGRQRLDEELVPHQSLAPAEEEQAPPDRPDVTYGIVPLRRTLLALQVRHQQVPQPDNVLQACLPAFVIINETAPHLQFVQLCLGQCWPHWQGNPHCAERHGRHPLAGFWQEPLVVGPGPRRIPLEVLLRDLALPDAEHDGQRPMHQSLLAGPSLCRMVRQLVPRLQLADGVVVKAWLEDDQRNELRAPDSRGGHQRRLPGAAHLRQRRRVEGGRANDTPSGWQVASLGRAHQQVCADAARTRHAVAGRLPDANGKQQQGQQPTAGRRPSKHCERWTSHASKLPGDKRMPLAGTRAPRI